MGVSEDEEREEKRKSLTWTSKDMKRAAEWSVDKEKERREMRKTAKAANRQESFLHAATH